MAVVQIFTIRATSIALTLGLVEALFIHNVRTVILKGIVQTCTTCRIRYSKQFEGKCATAANMRTKVT